MRKFLSQFLSAAQIDEIEKAFKEKNPDSSGLPTYIAKSRLDEEIGKRKTAEDNLKNAESAQKKAIEEAVKPLQEKLSAIPEDWQTQLEAAKKAATDVKTEYEGKLTAAQKEAEVAAKIYESGARNVKAVKALLDTTGDVDAQLKGLKETDSYLFNGGSLGKGTGKGDGQHGGDGDDRGKGERHIPVSKMYEAVGIPAPEEK